MRSLIIANGVKNHWPDAVIHFALSKHAPYAQSCPFNTFILEDSATKQVKAVNNIISELKPDIVVFDASGRKAQLKHAHKVGAKVIFISQHKKKRSRGLKIGRSLVTDSHWVVQPEFAIAPLSLFERFKLWLIGKPLPLVTGPIFTNPSAMEKNKLLTEYNLVDEPFILFSAGSGGHKCSYGYAADLFLDVAVDTKRRHGIKPVVVLGDNYPKELPNIEGVICIRSLDNADFINLVSSAKAAVLSGGGTLLQAVAMHIPTLAIAVAKDQPPRVKACLEREVILSTSLNYDEMCKGVSALLAPETLARLMNKTKQMKSVNGLEVCITDITRLLEDK
ncbi:hypothetical protein L2719_16965 [Shewanella schlegeliana]|nr:hypothetical protein [Shewanella schlegeliana]MCL1111228.1 hypothetical protein [Shewanella schlegeliana]